MKKYLKLLRLPQQSIALVPLLFGALDAKYYNWSVLTSIAIGVFLISISHFVINEYVDSQDTDQFNERNKTDLNHRQHKNIIFAIYIFLTIAGSAIFLYYHLYIALALYLFFGNFYSIKPLRFKANFPWDMIAPAIAWGAVPYSIAFTLNHLPYEAMVSVASVSGLLFGFGMQAVHYLADGQADKKAGIKNWCTVLGYKNFLRIVDKVAIASLMGFVYLVYRHESWWYYPLIFNLAYMLIIIGYARAAIYEPNLDRLHSIARRSFRRGVWMFAAIMVYLILALWKNSPTS